MSEIIYHDHLIIVHTEFFNNRFIIYLHPVVIASSTTIYRSVLEDVYSITLHLHFKITSFRPVPGNI